MGRGLSGLDQKDSRSLRRRHPSCSRSVIKRLLKEPTNWFHTTKCLFLVPYVDKVEQV